MGDDDRTLWVGNLSENVDEDLLYELFLQAGPVENVTIKKPANGQNPFGFVTYQHEDSVGYAIVLLEGSLLFGRPINMRERSANPDSKYKRLMADFMRHRERYLRNSFSPRESERPRSMDRSRQDEYERQSYDHDTRHYRDFRCQERNNDRRPDRRHR